MWSIALCVALVASPAWAVLEQIMAVHCGFDRPVLFLAMGPTGSGKTFQEQQLISLFNLRSDKLVKAPPKMLLVDELIERDPGYRQHILDFLRKELGPSPTEEDVGMWVAAASPEVYDYFTKQYFGCRHDWGCNNMGRGGCADIFEKMADDAFFGGDNIIWETTGKHYPADKIELASALWGGDKYDVVVGINTVDFCDLKARNSNRAASAIIKFLAAPENLTNAAPRLPDLNLLGPAVQNILQAAEGIVDCVGEPISSKCPAHIDELFLFANEHWGFLPSVKVKAPKIVSPETLASLSKLKAEAKAMLKFMAPRACSAAQDVTIHV